MASAAMATAPTRYAGFWIRVVAYIIDAVILGIVNSVVFAFFGGGMSALVRPGQDSAPNVGAMLAALSTVLLITSAIHLCYYIFLESSEKQATVGKMVLGLKVTDLNGRRISIGQAAGRTFSKIISGLILCIGYIMVGLTEKKQGLHDMIASTLVVRTN